MKRLYLVAVILVAVSLACAVPVGTPVPTVEPTATRQVIPTATKPNLVAAPSDNLVAVVQIAVNVRALPSGSSTSIGAVYSGDQLEKLYCLKEWCKVNQPSGSDWQQPSGWIFRGCLSDNPDELGCVAK